MVPLKAAGFASLLTYLTIICKSPFIQNWIYIITIHVQLTTQLKWNQRSALRPSPHFIPSLGKNSCSSCHVHFQTFNLEFFFKAQSSEWHQWIQLWFFSKNVAINWWNNLCNIKYVFWDTNLLAFFFTFGGLPPQPCDWSRKWLPKKTQRSSVAESKATESDLPTLTSVKWKPTWRLLEHSPKCSIEKNIYIYTSDSFMVDCPALHVSFPRILQVSGISLNTCEFFRKAACLKSCWACCNFLTVMAAQPTPPNVIPSEIMLQWGLPKGNQPIVSKPLIRRLICWGGTSGGGWLTKAMTNQTRGPTSGRHHLQVVTKVVN